MNGYDRIKAALAGEPADKTPVMLHNFMMAAAEAGVSMGDYRDNPQTIANIQFYGNPSSVGYFRGGYFLGFEKPEGIILTSGYADNADKSNICNTDQNASVNNAVAVSASTTIAGASAWSGPPGSSGLSQAM